MILGYIIAKELMSDMRNTILTDMRDKYRPEQHKSFKEIEAKIFPNLKKV